MARRGFALVSVVALLILGACSKNNKSVSSDPGFIQGRVTVDGTGFPGVTILISAYQLSDSGSAKRDGALYQFDSAADGDYSIEVLPGQYRIEYSAVYQGENLTAYRYPIEVGSGATVTVNVELKDPVPSNLIATNGEVSVSLSFNPGYNAATHNIYRSPNDRDDFVFVRAIYYYHDLTTVSDWPPEIGAYKYRVTSVVNDLESAPSNIANVYFEASIRPPQNFTAADNLTFVELRWYNNSLATQYNIFRSTAGGSWNLIASTSVTQYIDVPPSYNTYAYRVTCASSYGTESIPTPVKTIVYDGRFDPPSRLSVDDGGSILYLYWNASGYDTHYNIYRSTIPDSEFVKIDSTEARYYSDHPLFDGTFYYKVSTVTAGGLESELSSSVSAVFDGLLEPPTRLTPVDYGLYINLYWYSVNWAGAYILYRSDDNGEVYNQVARIGASSTYINDYPTTAGDKYYRIATETMDGVIGELSPPVIIRFNNNLLAPQQVYARNLGLSIIITWNYVYGATGYTLYRAPQADGDYMEIRQIGAGDASTTDTPPAAGPYYYRVQAFDNHNHRSLMSNYSYVYFTACPLPPDYIYPYDQAYNVVVQWNPVQGISNYIIFKSTAFDGNYTAFDTTSSNTSFDWPPRAGHYFYKVKSLYGDTVSDFSNYGHVYFSGILPAPTDLTGMDYGPSVFLNWTSNLNASEYDVYRGLNPSQMVLNQTVYNSEATDTPDSAGTYYYGVVAKTQGGLESPMTIPISVVFTP